MAFKYPPKPWEEGQKARLMSNSTVEFLYSKSLRKWIPITPGFESKTELEEAYGVSTIQELNTKFVYLEQSQDYQDSDIRLSGRIWKKINTPDNPRENDIWIDPISGKSFNYVEEQDAWIEFAY